MTEQPTLASFTTLPSSRIDDLEKVIQGAADGETATVSSGITDTLNEMNLPVPFSDSLPDWVPPGLVPKELNIMTLVAARCENVPSFDKRLEDLLPNLNLDLSDLPCGLGDKINEFLDKFEDKVKDKVTALGNWRPGDNGDDKINPENSPRGKPVITKIIPGSDPMEVMLNQKTVAGFTNSEDVPVPVDDALTTATAGGLMRQSTRFGLADNVKVLMENSPPGTDKSMLHLYLLGSMDRPIDAGNIDVINACTDVTGGEAFLAVYPDAIQRILAGYTLPIDSTEDINESEGVRLIDCLDRISPTWDRYQSIPVMSEDSSKIVSYKCDRPTLAPFIKAGEDAITVLTLNARTRVSVILSTHARTMRIQTAVKLYYPYAGLG